MPSPRGCSVGGVPLDRTDYDDAWWAERRREYVDKNDLIFESSDWEWISPYDFYRTIFPEGFLEQRGKMINWDEPDGGKPNAIAIQITNRTHIVTTKSGRETERHEVERYTITDDLDGIEERFLDSLDKNEPCFIAPVSYFGKERTARNARYLHAFAIDLDGVGPRQVSNILKQIRNGHDSRLHMAASLPQPTFLVNSGTGLHLYYVLDQPIPLVPKSVTFLQAIKESLTSYVWRDTTSTLDKVQYQGIYQSFRMVGSTTKLNGSRDDSKRTGKYEAVAFVHNGSDGKPWRCSIEYLMSYAGLKRGSKGREELAQLRETAGKTPLERAKDLWPDWYQRRILHGEPPKRWTANRAVYDWWREQIYMGASDQHRYWCLNVLAAYATKCGIAYEELERDALDFVPFLESLTARPDNHFTEEDALDAISSYDDGVIHKLTVDRIRRRTGIDVPKTKRNGREQRAHLKIASAARWAGRDGNDSDGSWRNKNGAPKKDELVKAYAREHPGANHSEIARALGISRTTVIKWLKS